MVKAIEHIKKEIAALEEAVTLIAQELKAAYGVYLNSLARGMRQQLILASYYICTQGYPERFLQLSLSQRQKLQQAIRKAAKKTSEGLISLTNMEGMQVDELEQQDILMNYLRQLEIHNNHEQEDKSESSENAEQDQKKHEIPDNHKQSGKTQSGNVPLSQVLSSNFLSLKVYSSEISNPAELIKWQQQIEARILANLKHISSEVNSVLKNTDILPRRLPASILDAAVIASETSAEIMSGPPNILNLLIEVETGGSSSEEPSLTQIMVLGLRLGEIEFADTQLSSLRKQIRYILSKLNKLGRQYQQRQREYSIAEAESAWRASWFED